MSTKYVVLYNPIAGNNTSLNQTKKLEELLPDGVFSYHNILDVKSYEEFFSQLEADDKVILSGGDGTLNRFVNNIAGCNPSNEILYFATGSGNDFLNDLELKKGCAPFSLGKYIRDLPHGIINGKIYRFINGIGLGLDGFCCCMGNLKRSRSSKPVNYTYIALKSVLYEFKPIGAKITVDGITKEYKKVWLISSMNGRFYGGGMMMAPAQNRLSENRELSFIVVHDVSRLRILTIFPSIFSGKHVKYKKYVEVLKGKNIKVEFSSKTLAQIDGETVTDVTGYEACVNEMSVDAVAEMRV